MTGSMIKRLYRYFPIIIILLLLVIAGLIVPQRLNALPPDSAPIGEWDGTYRRIHVPVLMYHYVSTPPADSGSIRLDLSVTPQNFRAQMKWLKDNGYHTITPDQLAGALLRGEKLPRNPIMLTFDDGYEDAYTNAFPILREFGFTGTFFLISGFIDEGRGGYMTWAMAKEMAQGGMYMQSHSRSHKDMRGRAIDWLAGEIVPPRDRIAEATGVRPRFFCYPSGQYDDSTIRALRDAGFIGAFTTADGTYTYTDNMMRVPRVRIRGSTTLAGFAHLINWDR